MSDVSRDEFEALQARVAELEDRLESGDVQSPTESAGLDQRDRSVLEYMDDHGPRSKRALVDLYISLTDIQDRSTAKRRAKNLEQTDAYREL